MDTIDKIKQLINETPNDMELGREVRKLIFNINESEKESVVDTDNWGDANDN